MDRREFELKYCEQLGCSVLFARGQGYRSAPCAEANDGWVAFAVPDGDAAEGEKIIRAFEARGVKRAEIRKFGEDYA